MSLEYGALAAISALWMAWLIYWLAAAYGTKTTQWREPASASAFHRVPLMMAVLCMVAPDRLPRVLGQRWLPGGLGGPMAGVAIVAAGLGFSVWARLHIGRNWSSSVTVKAGHSLTRTGPYRFVRHPIYTGLLLAFLGTAVGVGEWRALLATALAVGAFIRKSRAEEARMRETFPEYEDYRRHTAALIPFVY